MGDNLDTDVDAEEILEISAEKLDEISEKKKKNSLLNEVLVTGLLKNINDKVNNKLDTDAQSELISIINERVKDGYEGGSVDLESEIEKAISFDEDPTDDHIISNANKNRAKRPPNRRLPSKESKLPFHNIQEHLNVEQIDEDFDNLFNDDTVNEQNQCVDASREDFEEKSYIDDFDALLEDNNEDLILGESNDVCNVEDDFDALLKSENIKINASKKMEKLLDIDQSMAQKDIDIEKVEENMVPIPIEVLKEKELADDDTKQETVVEDMKRKTETSEEKIGNEYQPELEGELGSDSSAIKSNTLEKMNIKDSLEDIFENLENNETNLKEIENMLMDNESSDGNNCKTKIQGEQIKDQFEDIFDELDEEILEDVDEGFKQICEHRENFFEEERGSLNLDIGINVFVTENSEKEKYNLDSEGQPIIGNTIGVNIAENKVANINIEESGEPYCQGEGVSNKADEKIKIKQEIEGAEIGMVDELAIFKMKIEELEREKEKLQNEIKLLTEKQVGCEVNKSGKKVIIPTENHDQEKLDEEIRNDTREAELLIQLKHLSERVEAQDTLLAETKEDNTVLRIQNQNLLESLNRANTNSKTKKSFDTPSLDWIDGDDSIEKKRLFLLEQELEDQKEVNKQLKAYVGDILINIIVQNPQILEKKK